jgi:glutamate synthase domain-containing protein 3
MLAVETVLDVSDLDLRRAGAAIKAYAGAAPLEIHHAGHLHGLCAGLKTGEFVVQGDAGDYLGALNDGATVRVQGNAGCYLADNMTRGLVVVSGSAGYGAGLYPYGGTLVVYGDAGDFSATMNKGAAIIIGGNVGDEAATYHLAGDLVVLGNAGRNFGNYLIRGALYLGGAYASLGHNVQETELAPADVEKLRDYFARYGLTADPVAFRKFVAKSTKPFYH